MSSGEMSLKKKKKDNKQLCIIISITRLYKWLLCKGLSEQK